MFFFSEYEICIRIVDKKGRVPSSGAWVGADAQFRFAAFHFRDDRAGSSWALPDSWIAPFVLLKLTRSGSGSLCNWLAVSCASWLLNSLARVKMVTQVRPTVWTNLTRSSIKFIWCLKPTPHVFSPKWDNFLWTTRCALSYEPKKIIFGNTSKTLSDSVYEHNHYAHFLN